MKLGVGDFRFLVLPVGECWDRRGTLQVVKGVKSEYYHHPAALRIRETVIWVVYDAFMVSEPRFRMTYVTEFTGDALRKLEENVKPVRSSIEACRSAEELAGLVTEYVREDVESAWGSWVGRWADFRDLTVHSLNCLLDMVAQAREKEQALLAIGI